MQRQEAQRQLLAANPLLTASPSSPIADEILKTPKQPLSADVAEFRPMRPNLNSSAPKLKFGDLLVPDSGTNHAPNLPAAPVRTKSASFDSGLATDTISLTDLHWYTTHVHLLTAAHAAGVMLRREDITSTEHKVNGKTKGTVFIHCHSTAKATRLYEWFRANNFQGKTINPQFVASNAAQTHKIPTGNGHRPLISTVLANHPPTNSHGGINFNRLRPQNRVQIQQAIGLGIPRPNSGPGRQGGFDRGFTAGGEGTWGVRQPDHHRFDYDRPLYTGDTGGDTDLAY